MNVCDSISSTLHTGLQDCQMVEDSFVHHLSNFDPYTMENLFFTSIAIEDLQLSIRVSNSTTEIQRAFKTVLISDPN